MSRFEWDADKAERNKLKHGIAFQDAAAGLLGLTYTQASTRSGEVRFISVCEANGRLITVVWTPRYGAIRIISARAARRNEKAQFGEGVRRSAEAGRH